MSLKKFREEFPALTKCLYADTAANGLMSQRVLNWRRDHDDNFLTGGTAMKLDHGNVFKKTKEKIGEIMNCQPERIGLVQNFSIGFNFIAEALAPAQNVLLLEGEYPSVAWPLESRDFNCLKIPVSKDLEGDIMAAVKHNKIEVLAVSLVQYLDGVLLRPSFFKELKTAFPNLLILADATQYCGFAPLDFNNSGIDVLGCSGYKWLLGGYGNGFFLFRPESLDRLRFKSTGFNAARGDISRQHAFSKPSHLEPGHLDQTAFGSLYSSLTLLQEIGFNTISKRNNLLSEKVKHTLEAWHLLPSSISAREKHSTIFNLPYRDDLWKVLENEKVVCSLRGTGIRISFHAYNTEDEIDRILGLIKKYS